ncbi:MAG: ribonuclease HI family protein [Peptococcaceae bacterium]|nr:ribonuclease HI family protein [Peptococcaceae bacterium]
MKFFVGIDGGSRGNPGPAALGVVIRDETGKVVRKDSHYLGTATNNFAEWSSLDHAVDILIELAREHGPVEADVQADSQLVVRQWNGVYRIKEPTLRRIALKIRKKLQAHPEITLRLHHVKREYNKEADALVNRVLDKYSKQ